MFSRKHEYEFMVLPDSTANRLPAASWVLKSHQDLASEGLKRRVSWAHVSWMAAKARLVVSPKSSERDWDMQAGSLQIPLSSGEALSCRAPVEGSASARQQQDLKLLHRNSPVSPSKILQKSCSLTNSSKFVLQDSCIANPLLTFLESSCFKFSINSKCCLF